MAMYRKPELEKFIRRKIPDVARVEWDESRGHGVVIVETTDGRRAGSRVPNTATDQPRRRENIVAALRHKLKESR